MSYFLPSFLQKRILRYALSRLELLDTDALGLEDLDITWGKRSTVELRDVGIHTKKLSALLRLSAPLSITRAKALLLRLTIPSDLYQSGILIEVHGVDVHTSADLYREENDESKRSKHVGQQSGKPSKQYKTDRPRSNQSHIHDPGGVESPGAILVGNDGNKIEGELPSPADLAQSFLQAEPGKERAELRAAIVQSQYMDSSQISDSATTEASTVGVGGEISLPTFLAEFLKGVVDRIEVRIKGVQIDLCMQLLFPPENDAESDSLEKAESVTFRLTIEGVSVEGVRNPSTSEALPDGEKTSIQLAPTSRRISIDRINASILCEPSLFSQAARSPISSPSATHASTVLGRGHRSPSPHLQDNSDDITNSDSLDLLPSKEDSAPTLEIYGLEGGLLPYRNFTTGSTSENGSPLMSSFSPTIDHEHVLDCPHRVPQNPGPSLRSEVKSRSLDSSFSRNLNYNSAQVLQGPPSPPANFNVFTGPAFDVTDSPSRLEIPASVNVRSVLPRVSSSMAIEDLTESKIFSHEEASSMYMSAISQTYLDRNENRTPAMPGEWESTFSDHESQDAEGPNVQGDPLLVAGLPQTPTKTGMTRDEVPLPPNWQFSAPKPSISCSKLSALSGNNKEEVAATPSDVRRSHVWSQAPASSADGIRQVSIIAKTILALDKIEIEIPTHLNSTGDGVSMDPDLKSGPSSQERRNMPNVAKSEEIEPPQSISVEINTLHLVSDMTLTKIALLTVHQMTRDLRQVDSIKNSSGGPSGFGGQMPDFNVNFGSLSWQFLDQVKGQALRKDLSFGPIEEVGSIARGSEVLLEAETKQLLIKQMKTKTTAISSISVGRFRFGYPLVDIVCFDSGLKMRDSTRDLLAPSHADLLITIEVSSGTRKIELFTLPIRLRLDLRKLDETFSWFGGLSSILDLGNSVRSTVTTVDPKKRESRSAQPSRGVHFEAFDSKRAFQNGQSPRIDKVTARVGGLAFELLSNQSTLRFEGTAIKIVSRNEGVGLVIDRMRLGGPYLKEGDGEPSAMIKLSSVRIEYLSTPKELDLERLLALVKPSRSEDKKKMDDGLLINTMLGQRRQGGVIRFTIDQIEGNINGIADLHHLPSIVEDLKQLSKVTKYLPEDDRPGILTLALVRGLKFEVYVDEQFGTASLASSDVEAAHIAFPSLIGLGIKSLRVVRNGTEELIGKSPPTDLDKESSPPPVWVRYIGNEMEPTIEVKLYNLCFEYRTTTLMAIMGLQEDVSHEEYLCDMISSVATLTSRTPIPSPAPKLSSQSSASSERSMTGPKIPIVDLQLKEISVGLNPRGCIAKARLILHQAHMISSTSAHNEVQTIMDITKASIMETDGKSGTPGTQPLNTNDNLQGFLGTGYVLIGTLTAAKINLRVVHPRGDVGRMVDAEVAGALLVLETCADSTQTLQIICNKLGPPTPRSTELKYRTEIVPVEDLLASFSGDAYVTSEGNQSDDETQDLSLDEGDMIDDDDPQNLEYVSSFCNPNALEPSHLINDSMLEDDLDSMASPSMISEKHMLESLGEYTQVAHGNTPLDFRENHFGADSAVGGTLVGDTGQIRYQPGSKSRIRDSALNARIRDVHLIWNLFDGYDWKNTRDKVGQAVVDVQARATERQSRKDNRKSLNLQDQDGDVIGDFLFNSIYIGIPANRDPADLARQVNRNIDDVASETGSYATSESSSPNPRGHGSRPREKRIKLNRSKSHKMTFELKGISADLIVSCPADRQTQSSIDIRVQDLEIFDHVPTSTWKKFATYMHDAGERESGVAMVRIEILNVRPVPELSASEIILKVNLQVVYFDCTDDCLGYYFTITTTCGPGCH